MKKIQNRLLVLVNPAKALAIYEQDMKPFTEGGKSKRGKEYEPKASIRTICKYIGSSAFDKVIEALNDANLCADLFESTISPIAIQVDSVDERCEIVRYR